MNPIRSTMCLEYLQKLRPRIEEVDQILASASESDEKENLILEYDQVTKDLTEGKFTSLPVFSKIIRETIKMIDAVIFISHLLFIIYCLSFIIYYYLLLISLLLDS